MSNTKPINTEAAVRPFKRALHAITTLCANMGDIKSSECRDYASPVDLPPLKLSDEMSATLETLQAYVHASAVSSGWWNDLSTGADLRGHRVAESLLLIHSEVSEATEAYRRNAMDEHLPHRRGVEVELADAVLRILDLAGSLDLDLSGAIVEKYNYNRTRSDHNPKARRAAGGKKF